MNNRKEMFYHNPLKIGGTINQNTVKATNNVALEKREKGIAKVPSYIYITFLPKEVFSSKPYSFGFLKGLR